jgi:hypothetical protein
MALDPDKCRVLAVAGDYRIVSEYEAVYLAAPNAVFDLCDVYGDPSCALIDVEAGWCVVGGMGLWVSHFGASFKETREEKPSYSTRQVIWPDRGPPYIEGLWRVDETLIHVLTDPGTEVASLYEVNVTTLAYRRL